MAKNYCVAVYLCDRAFGGNEEGGWWFDTGEMVKLIRVFRDENKAIEFSRRFNEKLEKTLNKGRYEISSVLSTGRYYAEVHDDCPPSHYPEVTPRYE